jgi:UDPglucose 6-dehydrogenase
MADTEESDCVTCIGAGRLGLCWALCVEKAGFKVKAVDVFPTYVDAINARTLRSHEPKLVEMLQQSTQLTATLSISEGVHFSRYIYIFVQTPSSGSDRHYDHTHLNDVLSQLNALRVKDKHVIICCTVMPGYIDTVLIGEGSKEAGDAIEQHTLRYVTNRPRICRMSPGGAEITKLSLNSFITLKIGMHTRRFAAAKPQARLPAHALSLFPCF